ncbi:MAG TPA: biopolymer transporter ExbD [Labilithrix sp.]|nr:biopolymer transporter ExbD [Labilithrix sp.]
MGASIQASTSGRRRQQSVPEINVTPLVDVVLVLLIIFMVIAPSLEHGEPVELPGIMQPDRAQKGKLDPVTVTVARSGTVYVEKAATTLEALPGALADIHAREPDRRVVLKGDGLVDYQKVRDVFAIVQGAGFGGVSLQVQKRGNGKEDPAESAEN